MTCPCVCLSKTRRQHTKYQTEEILGSIKNASPQEKKFYMLAVLCKIDQLNTENRATYEKQHRDGLCLLKPIVPLPKRIFLETYNMWKARMSLNFNFLRLRGKRKITIQPLEDFPDFITKPVFKNSYSCFDILAEVTKLFFLGMDVVLLKGIDIERDNWQVTSRHHPVINKKQYRIGDVHRCLRKTMQNDAYCALGVCWTDFYPQENLNFVLGEASGTFRVGAFCFGRYEPKAYVNGKPPPPITAVDGPLLWKMIKVITHETCHIFGLGHCFFFECAMNESKSIAEAMSQPFHLCPVCVKKLQKVCGFSITQRCQLLRDFLADLQAEFPYGKLEDTVNWYTNCLQYLCDENITTHL